MNSKSVLRIILKNISFRTCLFFLLQFLFFYNGVLQAQWVQTNGPNGRYIYGLAVNGSNVFAGTDNGVYLSTNNGTNWKQVNNGMTNYGYGVISLIVIDANIFAGTDGGGVYLSTNNGTDWTQVNNGLANKSVFHLAISGTNIFAGTDNGVFLSTNDGASWTNKSNGLNGFHINAFAVRGFEIFTTTYYGVYRTTDNGTNWIQAGMVNTGATSLAVSGSNIFAGTAYNGMFLSKNDGTNWIQINSGFFNNELVWTLEVSGVNVFAGTTGGVLLSTNNGTIWTQVDFTNYNVLSLAVSGNNIYAGTDSFGVWRRSLSELVGVSKEVNNLSCEFTLSQNYPNPFNPNTVISYSLPLASNVKLILYNSLGQTVKVIENGFKNVGNYSITFNAGELSSGIYFYKLEAGQFSQVKKMMLIK